MIQKIGLAIVTTLTLSCKAPASSEIQSLAECLRDNQVTMYGTSWCGACEYQKELFGGSWETVPYVDCEQQPEKCSRIEAYPSWVLKDGTVLRGSRNLERLARETGCEYR